MTFYAPATEREHMQEAASGITTESTTERSRGVPRRPPSVWVYFVRATALQLIKIGRARDVEQRFSALQVGSPDKLELMGVVRPPNPDLYEAELHTRFQRHRSHGEWFQPVDALVRFIAANAVSLAVDRQRLIFEAYERMGMGTAREGEEFIARMAAEDWAPAGVLDKVETPRELIALEHPLKPRLPVGVEIKGSGRKAILARYKLARGIVD